ncbi:MAG TPA: tryptophan--tRNA ligase [Pilimelia sp.]|nr:tryptophan--tRNA ligase [Pilimelia sp.]
MTTTVRTRTTRRLTGLKPTGHLHLGNLLGAIRPLVAAQYDTESVVIVVDLHALTVEHDPHRVRALTLEQATTLLAAGIDPERSLFYVQSHVPHHAELHYLLECATGYGEAHRMIQFKERAGRDRAGLRLSLLTYPVLMAADILLHDTDEVPVGDDQTQHLELARDIATRFNARYGHTFAVPRAVNPVAAARVMDLTEPTSKMAKSGADDGRGFAAGTIFSLDPPAAVRRKVMRAVTDSVGEIRYDPAGQPGVANLLEIFAGCVGGSPAAHAAAFTSYGELKGAVAEAVDATLRPIRQRYAELAKDPGYVRQVLVEGADRARDSAADTVHRARRALGLL